MTEHSGDVGIHLLTGAQVCRHDDTDSRISNRNICKVA